ncbi:Uncharacterized protein TCM_044347 [Theobroma cacao]|uniref:Putative plant transposon protein domain-containing protein n=1 Tax=Theobroma cacao TaxID=3641 RepID=A0A061FQF7_THECC|nr:Uncharacterized protein TCM_044347 [Theobroma cacao]
MQLRNKIDNDKTVSFKASVMKRDIKILLYFVLEKMLPSTHINDVTRERGLLIYVIVIGKSINIVQLISNAILHIARTNQDGLWFPSLIAALCGRADVHWDKSEELLHRKAPIDVGFIRRYYDPSIASSNYSSTPRPRAAWP